MKIQKIYITSKGSYIPKDGMSFGGGGQSQPSSTTQRVEPPKYLRPFLTEAAQEASALYGSGSPLVPDTAAQTEQALQLAEQRALAGSPLVPAAQQQALSTITGQGLNPYLQQAQEAAIRPLTTQFTEQVLPTLAGQAASAGRTGSGLVASAEDRALQGYLREAGDISSRIGLAATEAERQRQLQTALAAPQLAQADYADIGRLAGVGAQREALQAAQLQEPYQRLNQYIAQITGSTTPGAGVTTATGSTSGGGGGLGGAIGGGLSGAATGATIGSVVPGIGTGIGAAVGGGLGLIGGLFG